MQNRVNENDKQKIGIRVDQSWFKSANMDGGAASSNAGWAQRSGGTQCPSLGSSMPTSCDLHLNLDLDLALDLVLDLDLDPVSVLLSLTQKVAVLLSLTQKSQVSSESSHEKLRSSATVCAGRSTCSGKKLQAVTNGSHTKTRSCYWNFKVELCDEGPTMPRKGLDSAASEMRTARIKISAQTQVDSPEGGS